MSSGCNIFLSITKSLHLDKDMPLTGNMNRNLSTK